MSEYQYASDRVLLYDEDPWNERGFGVPNFGNNLGTKSFAVWNLADYIGQAQLFIMSHIDAQRTQPPSRNTVERLGKLLNRINSVLGGRSTPYNKSRLEEQHVSGTLKVWNIHPVPYFRSDLTRNHWLQEYNELCMIALANMFQHSDNNLSLTVTEKFAQDVWQYFAEMKRLLGAELLLLPPESVVDDTFLFTDEHFDAYSPEKVTINFEAMDTPGPIQSTATEDDLRPLFNGIAANVIGPSLKQYPVVSAADISGASLPPSSGAVGTEDGSAVSGEGRNIGEPQT